MNSHAAAARELYGTDQAVVVDCVISDVDRAPLSAKLRGLLEIAAHTQINGKTVTEQDITEARKHGATDREIHDTVLIAAAFSMFNRYVDGLASLTPTDPEAYKEMGKRMVEKGYALPSSK